MSTTRREFLSQAAIVAAVAGVGPGLLSAEPFLRASNSRRQSKRPYLDVAVRCAQWIDASTQERPSGLAWPADPLKPTPAVGLDFYNGSPGVVYFLANLYHATGDARWRDRAQKGGAYLLAESARMGEQPNAGLYTGLAGLGSVYLTLDLLNVGPGWREAARTAASTLAARAKAIDDGVEWSVSNDIISGTAGTGLFLLHASSALKDTSLADVAVRAGRRLLKTGVPAQGGTMWFPSGSGPGANYPNFSHGTSGIAYFLATLHQQTGDRAFLEGALAGARYLEAVATKRAGRGRAIFHVTGGGEDRFYLSWCHGPVGTARLFWRLFQISHDQQWSSWLDDLTTWLTTSGAPEQQSAGYWNNISQCCGNVGIGQYWIDLARNQPTRVSVPFDRLRERIIDNTLSRATGDASGLRWGQAENRVSPESVVAQTGFMQGAAGVGTFFLQLDALERGVKWPTPWPDTPWV